MCCGVGVAGGRLSPNPISCVKNNREGRSAAKNLPNGLWQLVERVRDCYLDTVLCKFPIAMLRGWLSKGLTKLSYFCTSSIQELLPR